MSDQLVAPSAGSFFSANKWTLLAGAGVAFLGYCVYFDHKRRSAPGYKRKVFEKRQKKLHPEAGDTSKIRNIPRADDPAAMQAFFLQEVQLGEEMLSRGNVDEGSEHIANAIVLCGQGEQLLQIFQQTLPPEHFNAVLEKLPGTRDRLSNLLNVADEPEDSGFQITDVTDQQPTFVDEDVE